MKYLDFIQKVKDAAKNIPNVNTLVLDDIMKINDQNVIYDALCLVLESADMNEDTTTLNMSLYYITKLDGKFHYYVGYDYGLRTLKRLATDLEIDNMNCTPFVHRFKDECVGIKGSFQLIVQSEQNCNEELQDYNTDRPYDFLELI